MSFTNTEIANNMIALLEKAKKHESLEDNNPKQFFNKIVKMAIEGKTILVVKTNKTDKKEEKPKSEYQLFLQEKLPEIKEKHPNIPNTERFKIVGQMWRELHPKESKKPKEPKKPKELKEPKKPKKKQTE